ncbi:MAG TPA: hypothetical protein VF092_00250 [Longimicrobium sp.]
MSDSAAACPACGRTMTPAQTQPRYSIPERPAPYEQPAAGYGSSTPQYGAPAPGYAPAGPYYAAPVDPLAQHRQTVQIGYILLAASFAFGPLYIVSAIIAYTKRDAVRGTWLESHCNWLVDTFLVSIAAFVVMIFGVLMAVLAFFPMAFLLMMVLGFGSLAWLVYRTVRGWMLFGEGKPAVGIVSPPRW